MDFCPSVKNNLNYRCVVQVTKITTTIKEDEQGQILGLSKFTISKSRTKMCEADMILDKENGHHKEKLDE